MNKALNPIFNTGYTRVQLISPFRHHQRLIYIHESIMNVYVCMRVCLEVKKILRFNPAISVSAKFFHRTYI